MNLLLLIGAGKSGTTSLYKLIIENFKSVYGISPSPRYKEKATLHEQVLTLPQYKGLWCHVESDLFSNRELWFLDASTRYSAYPFFPSFFSYFSPSDFSDIKIIYIIRDPLERIRSHINYTVTGPVASHLGIRRLDSINLVTPELIAFSDYWLQLAQYSFIQRDHILIIDINELNSLRALLRKLELFIGVEQGRGSDYCTGLRENIGGSTLTLSDKLRALPFARAFYSIALRKVVSPALLEKVRLFEESSPFIPSRPFVAREALTEQETELIVRSLRLNMKRFSTDWAFDCSAWPSWKYFL